MQKSPKTPRMQNPYCVNYDRLVDLSAAGTCTPAVHDVYEFVLVFAPTVVTRHTHTISLVCAPATFNPFPRKSVHNRLETPACSNFCTERIFRSCDPQF